MPAYDTVPTVLWPGLKIDAAMSIGGTVTLEVVDIAAVVRTASRWHHNGDPASASALAVADALLQAIKGGLINPKGNVAKLVRKRAQRLLSLVG